MKTNTRMIVTVLGIVLAFVAMAQPNGEVNKSKMSAFDSWVGNWSGSGKMSKPGGVQQAFTQKETIEKQLDGTVLLVKGQGFDEKGARVHNALAILYYDAAKENYKMRSFLENGQTTLGDVELTDTGFKWWFTLENGGTVTYYITLEDKVWKEKGFYSPDGQASYPYIEFELRKK